MQVLMLLLSSSGKYIAVKDTINDIHRVNIIFQFAISPSLELLDELSSNYVTSIDGK